MKRVLIAVSMLGLACGGDEAAEPFGLGESLGGQDSGGVSDDDDDDDDDDDAVDDGADDGGPDDGDDDDDDDDDGPDPGGSTGGDDGPLLQECTYESTSYGEGFLELDVPTGSDLTLTFFVPGLPAPDQIESATLRFDSYDADHPGEEGVVSINGAGAYDLPADAGWDNQNGNGTIDVSGTLVAGMNQIDFGAGSLVPRSFYQVGNVALDITAYVDECDAPPDGPEGNPVPRQVEYQDAMYTERQNWVLRCDDYAFTAYGDEHIDSDCEGLYDPDGNRTGTATFFFDQVEAGTYEIQIRSRHTENRNPQGALFVVNGEGKRINQRDDAGYTTDSWGIRDLAGDVTVVLDSTQEAESDSVIWVRLEPNG